MKGPSTIADYRFLVLAPIGRDAELIVQQLARAAISSLAVKTSDEALELAARGAAGVIVAEEALTRFALESWRRFIAAQPPWSDLPFVLLGGGELERASHAVQSMRELLGNVTVLDRPVRTELLVSVCTSALRARKRQYEMRDAMEMQRVTQTALRRAEKLAVAGRMAATISHEINNPLSAIMNLIYLASHTGKTEEIKQYLAMAQDELRRVSEIVHQTLRFHRAPSAPAETDVGEMLDSCLGVFTHKLARSGIEVTRDWDEKLVAFCSPGEIRQAIVNLVANAIDAMPHGGRLRVRARRLRGAFGDGVILFIADTGTGIPPQVRARLFQQFFTTKGTTGTGLGLWLTRDIVSNNGGRIRCRTRTEAPSGTVFAMWLPAQAAARDEAATASEIKAAAD